MEGVWSYVGGRLEALPSHRLRAGVLCCVTFPLLPSSGSSEGGCVAPSLLVEGPETQDIHQVPNSP